MISGTIARLIAAAAVIGFGLGRLGAHSWLLDLFSHFQLQYAAALIVAALLFAIRRERGLGLVSLAAALLLAWPAARDLAVQPAHANASATLKVMTLNAWFRNADTARVAEYIERSAADVVFVQEFDGQRMRELAKLLPSYPHVAQQGAENRHGAAIVSRWPLTHTHALSLDSSDVMAQRADLTWENQTVELFAVHLTWPMSSVEASARNHQRRALIDWMRKEETPWIVAGDLNLTPWSPNFRLIRDPAIQHCTSHRRYMNTWPSFAIALGLQIDHCFVSPHWHVVNVKQGEHVGSDHLPVIYELAPAQPRARITRRDRDG